MSLTPILPPPCPPRCRREELTTFAIVATGSILFCSKGVVAKLAYSHGLDPISLLNLRMLFSLPLFAIVVAVKAGGFPRLAARDWLRLFGLGFIGYYFSSLVNFMGLQYITVGLERVILYTYPTLVLVLSAVVFRKRVRAVAWVAAGVAWLGVLVAFAGELGSTSATPKSVQGGLLVFLSACSYAFFIILSGPTIERMGSLLFAGIAVGISCLLMMLHFLILHPWQALLGYPQAVYGHGVLLAVFGTVLPALLMTWGLKRAGPQRFAVMGSVGPIATLFLAWLLLGEGPQALQFIGLGLALVGGLAISQIRAPL